MSVTDIEAVSRIARLAVLAMCARGVALAEFSTSPEVHEINLSVKRSDDGQEPVVELFFVDSSNSELGGVAL